MNHRWAFHIYSHTQTSFSDERCWQHWIFLLHIDRHIETLGTEDILDYLGVSWHVNFLSAIWCCNCPMFYIFIWLYLDGLLYWNCHFWRTVSFGGSSADNLQKPQTEFVFYNFPMEHPCNNNSFSRSGKSFQQYIKIFRHRDLQVRCVPQVAPFLTTASLHQLDLKRHGSSERVFP